MKAFDSANLGKVLVVRQKGHIYATGNVCSHYGAPLNTGALGDGRVRCPWHGACFNLATGDIEDFPGLDGLPTFKVSVQDDGGVKVQGLRKQLTPGQKNVCMATICASSKLDTRTFIVIGGGPAAQVCVETLRNGGFQGKVIMLTKEPYLPYDRVLLSKTLETSAEKLALRSSSFYKKCNIDLKLGMELLTVNTEEKVIVVSSGEKIYYDSLFLATGSRARALSVPGSDLQNIFKLRNIENTKSIAKEIQEKKKIVIVGASFIGMECAAYCVDKVESVTVVGLESVPFEAILGSQVGGQIMRWFEEKGVQFCMNVSTIEALPSEADSSRVGQIKLSDGKVLPADIVIAGIGVVAETDYLKGSNVKTRENGTVPVNEFLETNIPGVFAGGDIAFAPVLGRVASIGHWQLAHYHGRVAGRNMLGKKEPLKTVPFFWTMLFGKGIRYAGYAPDFDDVIIHGNLNEMDYIAYYCKENSVLAISSCNNAPIASQFAELLFSGKSITKSEVQESPTAWTSKLFD